MCMALWKGDQGKNMNKTNNRRSRGDEEEHIVNFASQVKSTLK